MGQQLQEIYSHSVVYLCISAENHHRDKFYKSRKIPCTAATTYPFIISSGLSKKKLPRLMPNLNFSSKYFLFFYLSIQIQINLIGILIEQAERIAKLSKENPDLIIAVNKHWCCFML